MRSTRDSDRTDGVGRKLRLLAEAHAAGRRDLAMSLADSIKDSLRYERMSGEGAWDGDDDTTPRLPGDFVPVERLPAEWASWARGWSSVRAVSLFETVGLRREREPVAVRLEFDADRAADPTRELRVALVEPDAGPREVPSQVDGLARDARGWRCRLLFQADVPAHGRATYLIFVGNRDAERPGYVTDLRVEGEGCGRTITNHHYVAQLSEQMGQLERLTSRREHGLELYAGGKGHGEPPGIDWAHDYVDHGGFQKLRMRNWASCPNFEVEAGPIAARVRRWGFPHSPLHPVFSPSRVHMDQSYTFLAGLPYFLKEGRIEAIVDLDVEAMRDDEWVFSGYSFDELLWVDRAGTLHRGPVPADLAEDLWGVGFRHRESRDAFLALRLTHEAEGLDSVSHGGSPTLHYPGHGQLWSRYPVQKARLNAGTTLRQRNAYQLFAFTEDGSADEVEQLRHRLLHPVEVAPTELPGEGRPVASAALARPGEAGEVSATKDEIWRALREVRDEQLYVSDANVVDLGLIYDVRWRHGTAHIVMTMPHRGRPVHDFFVFQGGGRVDEGIRERLLRIDGIRDVVVDRTWEPAWTPARLTDPGRKALGLEQA